jgi:AraC-like DNA-binding protein
MVTTTTVGGLTSLLRGEQQRPIVALRYRSVFATQHGVGRDTRWRWVPQQTDGTEMAALLVSSIPLEVRGADGQAREVPPGALTFLHPHRPASVSALMGGTVMIAWVPWSELAEVESGVGSPVEVIPASALGRGLHAFLDSLLTQPSEPTMYTDYLAERLIAEMVFGVLIEAAPHTAISGIEPSGITRARTLIMVRRNDSDFNVARLAQELHMSLRNLQRIFSNAGSTPGDELRRARVHLAQELLANPSSAALGISGIAALAGFRDASALRRAFASAGLGSPRALRQASHPRGADEAP